MADPIEGGSLPIVEKTIAEIVRKQERDFVYGTTTISKYVVHSMHDTLEKIDAYLNSKHTSGEYDSLGREKPFFNIVTAAVNVWFRATNIDSKDIRFKATNAYEVVLAFLATIKLANWMRRTKFGVFLKEWGRALARYGGAVVKFCEKNGVLYAEYVAWNRLIVDPVDFDQNPVIEILELTESELRTNTAYDQTQVDALINTRAARQTLDRRNKDSKADYVKLYEVHLIGSLSLLKRSQGREDEISEGDSKIFVQQMHVVSFVAMKKGEYEDFTLISGKEERSPYMLTSLLREDGRTLPIGAVEHLFEAQWMANHNAKNIKDQLDLASRLVYQTADGSFVGQNALIAIETGDILIHANNQPLMPLAHNVTATPIESFMTMWLNQAKEITSTPDAITGQNMPSGTAYRQVAILNQESHSLFEVMTENKGLALEDMLRTFIIPHLKRRDLNNSKQIAAALTENGIKHIEGMYIKSEAIRRNKRKVIDSLVAGETPNPLSQQGAESEVQDDLSSSGSQRFFVPSQISNKTWKEMFKDFEWEVEIDITNESSDKNEVLTTLTNLLQTIASRQGQPLTQVEQFLFNKILVATGDISPIEVEMNTPATPPSAQSAQKTPAESINFKDLPPDAQAQMAKQAGISISSPQSVAQPSP